MPWFDWLSLFIRWFHVIAGVAWIGASFYFIWLDNSLREPPKWKKDKGIKGDLWAVHGGGFYEVAKYQYGPEKIPETLHWFKWEAYTTWISGMLLLVLVYYFGASAYLIDPSVKQLEPLQAIGMGIGVILAGFILYEFACRSRLANYPILFALLLLILLSVASWLTTEWFSGRGAYIHVGALIGTIMAGNVFLKIIPAQRLMVEAVTNKQDINPEWGQAAKLRSVHNNYLTLPLLFVMISNHYPMTYQHPQNWLVLIAICIVSAWIRHYFNVKHSGQSRPSILVTGAMGMLAISLWVSWPSEKLSSDIARAASETQTVSFISKETVTAIVTEHCANCHSDSPTDAMFTIAPLGLVLDDWTQIEAKANLIYQRTVVTKDMPFLNKTKMSEQERAILDDWYQQLNN